ncbi:MAG: helix-turn-helix transcriptional regulator [Clostridia bacterium]|nr:helix-turn-helix transcriptional regulator [Clostridia bacterium]
MEGQKEVTPLVFGERLVRVIPYQKIPPHTGCFGPHWHKRMEIIRMLEGSISFSVGNTTVKLRPGTLGIVSPYQVHHGMSGDEHAVFEVTAFDVQNLCCSPVTTQKYVDPLLRRRTIFYPVTQEPEILRLYQNLIQLYTQNESPLQIIGALYTLLGAFYLHGIAFERVSSKTDGPINRAIDYINDHFLEKETTLSLSKRFGYNVSYFCRCFKNATGLPIMKYIQILRLEYAQQLLEATTESVSAIATQSGFSGLTHFTHSFTDHFGLSPTAYRQNLKE